MPHHLCGVYSILTIFNQDRPNPNRKKAKKNNSVELSRHGSIKNVTCIEYANAKIYRISRMCIDYEQIQRMNEQKKNSIESSECLKCPTLGLHFYAFHNNCLFTEKKQYVGKKPARKKFVSSEHR